MIYWRSMYFRCDSHLVSANSLSGPSVTVANTFVPSIGYFPFVNVSRFWLFINAKAFSHSSWFLWYWVANATLSVDWWGEYLEFFFQSFCLNQLAAFFESHSLSEVFCPTDLSLMSVSKLSRNAKK